MTAPTRTQSGKTPGKTSSKTPAHRTAKTGRTEKTQPRTEREPKDPRAKRIDELPAQRTTTRGTRATGRTAAPAKPAKPTKPAKPVRRVEPVAEPSAEPARKRSGAAERAYAKRAQRVSQHERIPAGQPLRLFRLPTSRASFVLLLMALLAGGVAATLWLSTQAISDSYRLEQLRARTAQLAEQSERLRQDVARQESPSVLSQRARELGMVPGGDPARLVVGEDGSVRTVGEPAEAQAPAPPPKPKPKPKPEQPQTQPHQGQASQHEQQAQQGARGAGQQGDNAAAAADSRERGDTGGG